MVIHIHSAFTTGSTDYQVYSPKSFCEGLIIYEVTNVFTTRDYYKRSPAHCRNRHSYRPAKLVARHQMTNYYFPFGCRRVESLTVGARYQVSNRIPRAGQITPRCKYFYCSCSAQIGPSRARGAHQSRGTKTEFVYSVHTQAERRQLPQQAHLEAACWCFFVWGGARWWRFYV